MCRNFCACSVIARTTSGCEWPVELTAMPAAQSRKTLPSTSSTIAPQPRSITSGYPRVYDGDTTVLSRSISALAFGPGSAVLISGWFVTSAFAGPEAMNGLSVRLKADTTVGPAKPDTTVPAAFVLFPLPSRSGGAVLEQHAASRQVVANAVGRSEIAAAARRLAIFDEALDLLDRNRRPFLFRTAQAEHTEHA